MSEPIILSSCDYNLGHKDEGDSDAESEADRSRSHSVAYDSRRTGRLCVPLGG